MASHGSYTSSIECSIPERIILPAPQGRLGFQPSNQVGHGVVFEKRELHAVA
jgi:hypothetical protein